MKDEDKTKRQLLDELIQMRRRMAELERAEGERRQAEEALQQSESKYRTLFDQATDGIMMMPIGETNFTVNQSFAKLHGYGSPKEMEHLTLSDLDTPETARLAPERLRRLVTGEAMNFEVEHYHKNGHKVLLNVSCNIIQIRGKPYFLGFHHDITHRKRAEEALRTSEEKYRSLFDNAPIGVFRTTADGRLLDANPELSRILGYSSPQELIDTTNWTSVAEALYADPDERLTRVVNKTLAGNGEWVQVEIRLHRRDGESITVRMLLRRILGRPDQSAILEGFAEDISERRRAEQALRSSEIKYRIVADNTYDWEYWVSPEGRYLYSSPSSERVTGHKPREYEDDPKLLSRIIHPDDKRHYEAHLEKCQTAGSSCECEFRISHRDGTTRWLGHVYQPVFDAEGQYLGRRGSNRDITDRKRGEEALREAHDELERRVEERTGELARVNDALRESKTLFENLARVSPVGIFRTDIQGNCAYVNERWCQIAGMRSDEVHGECWFRAIHPEDRQRVDEEWTRCVQNNMPFRLEYRFLRPDGVATSLLGQASPEVNHLGETVGYVGTITDITEQKQVEGALRESEEKFRVLFHTLRDGLLLADKETRKFLEGNPAMLEMLGYSGEEFEQLGVEDIHPEQVLPLAMKQFGELAEGKITIAQEIPVRRKDGSVFYADISASFPMLFNGKEVLMGAFRDITERKRTQEALRESEARYRQLFATVPDAIFIFDADTRQFIDTNQSASSLYGYTREEFLKMKQGDITAESQLSDLSINGTLATGDRVKVPLRWHRKKDGTVFPVELSGGTFILAGRRALGAAVRDITERLRAEEELSRYRDHLEELVKERTSELSRANEQLTRLIEDHRRTGEDLKEREEFLTAIVENIPDMIFVKDAKELRFVRFNRAGEELLGYRRDDLIGKSDYDLFSRQEADFFTTKDREVLLSRHLVDIQEETIQTRRLGQRILHTKKIPILDQDGNPQYLLGISQDITERKQAEAALLKSEEKYRALIETTDTGYLILDAESKVTDANIEYVRLSGHTTLKEILGKSVIEWTAEYDRERNASQVIKCLEQGFIRNLEIDYADKQGRITPIEINATVLTAGQSLQVVSLCRDISERKRAAEALQASEHRYKLLLSSVTDYIFTIEIKDGLPVSTTHGQGCIAVTGFTPEDYVRMPYLWYEMVHPEDQHIVKQHAETALRGEAKAPLEHRIIHKGGTTRWVRNTIVPRYDAVGRLVACDGLVSDITDRKNVEYELKQTNTYLENIFENSPDAIGIVDGSGRFIRWNRMAAELYGYTLKEMKGKSGFDLYADKDELQRMLVQLRREGSVKKWEMKMRRKDGDIVPFEISIGLLRGSQNKTLGSVAVARDLSGIKEALATVKVANEQLSEEITERRRAEEALFKSEETLQQSEKNLRSLTSQLFTIQEKERNRISKELHDGLGQDLTVLKIYLTSIQNKLKEDQSSLKDDCDFLLSRIDHSVADMRRLCHDLSPYLLEELGLAASLKHLFDEVCQRNRLHCLLDLQDISPYFPRRTLAAVYRIFQEALTNIVKHSGATQVSLSIKRQGEHVNFMVADNGKGFDIREVSQRPAPKKGMGLFAMQERTHMLGGAFQILSQTGRGTMISFSLTLKERQ